MHAPAGGVGRLVEALAAALGNRVKSGIHVERIAGDKDGATVDGDRYDAVVIAIPAEDAAAIVAVPELATRLGAFHRAPMALAYLGFDGGAVPVRDGFGFLAAHGEDLRVLGVVFESVVWPHRAPDGKVLLRCVYGGGRDPEAVALPDGELIAQARRDVGKALGITGEPVHASTIRWKRGVAQYRLGHRDRVRDAVALARGHRIALAGSDYRGPGVNDLCADAAVVAADVASWR
jgi:oxygen-dependent protoporphyrinogen oxidase